MRSNIYLERERIAVENSARDIMDVGERLTGRSTKAAHHAPGRLLLLDAEDGGTRVVRFKRQVEVR
jgi:hypothetical protein